MQENNTLHKQIIDIKEASSRDLRELRVQLKDLEQTKADLQFMQSQTENQLNESKVQLMNMQTRLQEALKASQAKNATQITKIFNEQEKSLQDQAASMSISDTVAAAPALTRE